MISLRTHNVIDYVTAVALVLVPYIFGFSHIEAARGLFITSGIALAVYSLLTKYYYSAAKIIPLGLHMVLDALIGVACILAPYVLGYRALLSSGQFAVHAVLGLGVLGLVAFTRPRSEATKTLEQRRETSGHERGGVDRFGTTGMVR